MITKQISYLERVEHLNWDQVQVFEIGFGYVFGNAFLTICLLSMMKLREAISGDSQLLELDRLKARAQGTILNSGNEPNNHSEQRELKPHQ